MQDIKTTARFAGLFALLTVLGGVFAQGYIARRLIVFADAAATASNILGNPDMLRLGFGVYMVEMACDIAKTALLYELLRPVNRSVNLVAAFLCLAGGVIKAVSRVFFVAPLLVLGMGTPSLAVFSPAQLQALSLLLLRINDHGAGTAVIFYAFSTPLTGYLMFRSGFLPRFLGVLQVVCGVGWLTFLYPPLYHRLFPVIVGLALLGVAVLSFWLLVFGVDEERWRRQVGAGQVVRA
jgi:hypothetical protein